MFPSKKKVEKAMVIVFVKKFKKENWIRKNTVDVLTANDISAMKYLKKVLLLVEPQYTFQLESDCA